MNIDEFNKSIKETLEIGNELIFKDFNETTFEMYKDKVHRIAEAGYKLLSDKVQLKACNNLSVKKEEDFKLSILQQICFADGKGTNGNINAKNTNEQIKKRYIYNLNCHLPILKSGKLK